MIARVVNRAVRFAATAAHHLLKANWFVRRPRTAGAHALALTPANKLILVRLRYAPGWRVPGGGRSPDEPAIDAVLRELREEIGMTNFGSVELAEAFEERTDFKRDHASIVIVRDVKYRPHRWSWEVEEVMEAGLDRLPPDLSPLTARWLAALRDRL